MVSDNYGWVELVVQVKIAERLSREDLHDTLSPDVATPGVYLLVHPVTRELYVGSSEHLYNARNEQLDHIENKTHPEPKVRAAFLRYPSEAWFFFIVTENRTEALRLGDSLLKAYVSHPKSLNASRWSIPSFNPLDQAVITESIVNALLAEPATPLRDVKRFTGSGIYALYYVGDFVAYAKSAERNRESKVEPIHVGKALWKGTRKGDAGMSVLSTALYDRLCEHTASIDQSTNLSIDDFYCRLLVVEDIWIPQVVVKLISSFAPLWNTVVDGFGNHDPGGGRYNGKLSRWDVLHPGRNWVDKCQARSESPEEIIRIVQEYTANLL